jgi:hypothetical protein
MNLVFNLQEMITTFDSFALPQSNQLHYKYDFAKEEDVYQLLSLTSVDFSEYIITFILRNLKWYEVEPKYILTLNTMETSINFFAFFHSYAKSYYILSFFKHYFEHNNDYLINQVRSYDVKFREKTLIQKQDFFYIILDVFFNHTFFDVISYYSERQKKFLAKHLRFMLDEYMIYDKSDCVELNKFFNDYWKEYLD